MITQPTAEEVVRLIRDMKLRALENGTNLDIIINPI